MCDWWTQGVGWLHEGYGDGRHDVNNEILLVECTLC